MLCSTEAGVYLPKFAFHLLWAVFALSSVSFSLDLWAQVCSTAFGLCLFCFPEPGNVAVHSLPVPQSVCLSVLCLAWELSWATLALITCLAQCLRSGVFLPVFAVKEGSDINWVAWHEVLHQSKICPRSAAGKSNLCGAREGGPPNSQPDTDMLSLCCF